MKVVAGPKWNAKDVKINADLELINVIFFIEINGN